MSNKWDSAFNKFETEFKSIGKNIYEAYLSDPRKGAELFLREAADLILSCEKRNKKRDTDKLGVGKFKGTLLEWFIYYLVLPAVEKNDEYCLEHQSKMEKESKVGKHKHKLADIVMRRRSDGEVLYAIEIKSNPEDGFPAYCEERCWFKEKYWFLGFASTTAKAAEEIKRLKNAWLFELSGNHPKKSSDEAMNDDAQAFLKKLYLGGKVDEFIKI